MSLISLTNNTHSTVLASYMQTYFCWSDILLVYLYLLIQQAVLWALGRWMMLSRTVFEWMTLSYWIHCSNWKMLPWIPRWESAKWVCCRWPPHLVRLVSLTTPQSTKKALGSTSGKLAYSTFIKCYKYVNNGSKYLEEIGIIRSLMVEFWGIIMSHIECQ